MNYMTKLARLSQADKKKAAEKVRLKERARVERHISRAQATDSAERGPAPKPTAAQRAAATRKSIMSKAAPGGSGYQLLLKAMTQKKR